MKKVLLLGGNGFIGTNLARILRQNKYGVISFDRNEAVEKINDVEYIIGDFFEDSEIFPIVDKCDIVVHCLCTLNPGNSNEEYLRGYENDLIQTIKLCKRLIDSNKKMLFISSGGTVYGKQDKMPINEKQLPCPINHYGSLKLCMENVMHAFNVQNGLHFVTARVANPYGPGQDYSRGVGFVDVVLKKAIRDETVEIWGDGSLIRDYVYIDDVCDALMKLLNYKGEEEIFNIGTGVGTSQNDIVSLVNSLGYNVSVNYLAQRSVDLEKVILDSSKIKSCLKVQFIDINDGIKKYHDWLKQV